MLIQEPGVYIATEQKRRRETKTGAYKDTPCIYPACPPSEQPLSTCFLFWEEIHFTLGYSLLIKEKVPFFLKNPLSE